jgi:nitroimidazol reductase NimA-like FMN-containing flavoprotein (pyridoxamine 5'-phosphate oxidase superfamily)
MTKEIAMQIRDMTGDECIALLERSSFGRFACAKDGQPYITPAFFAFEENCLYSFAAEGKKIGWMRENPSVCVEIDDIKNPQSWQSVVVAGKFEELPATPQNKGIRLHAHELLEQRNPLWWEPAFVKRTKTDGSERPLVGIYFRIWIEQVSGRQALPDSASASGTERGEHHSRWWTRILGSGSRKNSWQHD